MLAPTTFYRTSMKALIFDEHKNILLTKDPEKGKWDFPGGGMDWGETPQECLAREIQEEMGIPTKSIAERPSYFYSQEGQGKVWFTYTIYEVTLEHLNFTPSNECSEIKFFSHEDLQKGSEDVFSNVTKFSEMYNPKNHG